MGDKERKLLKTNDPWGLLYEWVKTDVINKVEYLSLKDYIIQYVLGIKDLDDNTLG